MSESEEKNEYVELAKEKYNEYSQLVIDKFNEHPHKNKMSCPSHLLEAMRYSAMSLGAGVIFFVHALFPMVFETTGSDMIASLHSHFEERKCKLANSGDVVEMQPLPLDEEVKDNQEEVEESF